MNSCRYLFCAPAATFQMKQKDDERVFFTTTKMATSIENAKVRKCAIMRERFAVKGAIM